MHPLTFPNKKIIKNFKKSMCVPTFKSLMEAIVYFKKGRCELLLRRAGEWNGLAVMKHIWNLFAEVGSPWVALVQEVLL